MSQLLYISSLSISFISVSPQLYFSSLFLISGLFLSILVPNSTSLLPKLPQLPTRIDYTSPPHQGHHSGHFVSISAFLGIALV
ncbi:MAG: hypothetical protein NXY57DRAFT_969846 [Lentinula lateritia]|nr:MAG: hypothetical protein NXY57DRAFT_969846 [Lentinula lateritia]